LTGANSYSPDPSKAIVSYEWDLNNDGDFNDAAGVTATIAGGFPAMGNYTVALRVTDNNPLAMGGPQTGISYYIVKVRPPDLNPVAVAGGPYLGSINVPVQLDGSGSWDADGANLNPYLNITKYEWDLDNDGIFDDATGATPLYTWTAPFVGTIALKVTDDGPHAAEPTPGYLGYDIAYANVAIGHHDPVSVPGGPYFCKPGHIVTMDGSGSYSPDSLAIEYSWDLNNDGTFGDSIIVNPAFAVGSVVGTVYNVALKVTDSLGGYDIKHTSITVVGNQAPDANAGPDQTIDTNNPSGETVYLDGSGSTDPNGDPLSYEWTWTDGSASGVNPAVFLPLGDTTITLTVYDDELASDTDTVTITVVLNDDGGGGGAGVWQLDSEVITPAVPVEPQAQAGANPIYQMEKNNGPGDDGQTGSVNVPSGGSRIWIADQAALTNVTFAADGAWKVELSTDSEWIDADASGCTVLIGQWDGGSFIPFSSVFDMFSVTWDTEVGKYIFELIGQSGDETVIKDNYLAIQITNTDDVDHTVYTAEGDEASCLTSPENDPGYPLPEMAAGILAGLGLVGLAAFVFIKSRKSKTVLS